MQVISNYKILSSITVHFEKEFKSQSLAKQVKTAEQLVSMVSATEKAFDIMGDDMVELFTESEALKIKMCPYDRKWLGKSKTRLLRQFDDKKRTNLIRSKMENEMKKQYLRVEKHSLSVFGTKKWLS